MPSPDCSPMFGERRERWQISRRGGIVLGPGSRRIVPKERTVNILARLLAGAGITACLASCGPAPGDATGGNGVSVADVHRFVAVWPEWSPADSDCVALRPYWDAKSPGLTAYRHQFHVSFGDLCAAVRKRPEQYAQLVPRVAELDSVATAVREIYARFDSIHPLINHPAVYLVVGTGISAGSTVRGRHPAILIGMERNRSSGGLPGTIAHELVHTQQQYPWFGSWSGGPSFLRGTLLRLTITEGAADFVAELVMGRAVRNEYGETHEAELWKEFQRDASGKNYDLWLYNGWNRDALGDRPPDIAYWVGYRIVKSFYEKAADKRQALDQILSIRDFPSFLRSSGYASGAGGEQSSTGEQR